MIFLMTVAWNGGAYLVAKYALWIALFASVWLSREDGKGELNPILLVTAYLIGIWAKSWNKYGNLEALMDNQVYYDDLWCQ